MKCFHILFFSGKNVKVRLVTDENNIDTSLVQYNYDSNGHNLSTQSNAANSLEYSDFYRDIANLGNSE